VLRVTASLDSMVVGESQILGQVKEAYAAAHSHQATGVILNALLHRALHTAKRIRTETGIGASAVSIPTAAIALVTLGIVWRWKVPEPLLIAAAGMLGLLLFRG